MADTGSHIDRAALASWLETHAHLYDCIGYSEGQACCLDKERVLAVLDTFIRVAPGARAGV